MQFMTLMATGNINCPLLGRNPELSPSYNFNSSPPPLVQNIGSGIINMQPKSSNDKSFSQELTIDVFDNQSIPNGLLNINSDVDLLSEPLNNILGINQNVLKWNNENLSNPYVQMNMRDSAIPEEQLSINIDTDEGGMHSWIPNLTNSLSSDFFLPQPDMEVLDGNRSKQFHPPELFLWDSQLEENPTASINDSQRVTRNSHMEAVGSYPRIDVQNHLQSQRTQLNCLKYEIINAKRRLHESQATVAKLACELEEKLLFQNSKDMQRLRDENAELRLECQCLCMEVDFYLKGKAPLGEVNETFYRKDVGVTKPGNESVQPQIGMKQEHYNSEEQEEANKWECPKCTFANHPAINSCEMCHMTRVRRKTTLPSSETCYCHPKEQNFS